MSDSEESDADHDDLSDEINEALKDDVHFIHCNHCFSLTCSFSDCLLTECALCYAPLHECKREDHREICRMEMIPCLNSSFGCPLSIRRSLLSRHLSVCPASVVSCGHERARHARDKPSKKELKVIGKRRREKEFDCPPSSANIPIDEALALYDQRLIIEGYTYSRADRVRRRDEINVREPQLPLRPIIDGSKEGGLKPSLPLSEQDLDVDSSDDERKIEEARIKKLRGIFADCYMCQVDPCVQHFHTLGRSDVRWDQLMYQRSRKSYYQMDPFYAERNLMVSLHVEKINEQARRSDTILKSHRSGTLYTRRCLAVIPRRDLDYHQNSQHVTGGDVDIESLIIRCPMWWKGCRFHSFRVQPNGGEIRFIQELGAFSFRPDTYPSPILSSSSPLLDAPDWLICELARFLSGVALNALASTCKQLRNTLFSSVVVDRGVVSLRWTKINRCRWTASSTLVWSFPLTEASPAFDVTPQSELSQHIGECHFNEPCPMPDFTKDDSIPVNGAVTCLPQAVRETVHDQIRKRFVEGD